MSDIFRLGVQTPNCIRQTVFDAVALDYQRVTVIIDATAAATPDIHIGMYSPASYLVKRNRFLKAVIFVLVYLLNHSFNSL